MINVEKLNEEFGIPGVLSFEKSDGNLIFLNVANNYADARITPYGAHITSFKPHNSKDILWMSPQSYFEVGKPIRGGIPVCFPWFGPHKTDNGKPQHGFGRLMYWEIAEAFVTENGATLVRFKLNSSEETKAYWPYEFCAEFTVVIGNVLNATLKVTNNSAIPFNYSCALHTYFNLSEIELIIIDGLTQARYHNHLEPGIFHNDSSKIKIHQAETRHYHDTEATCLIEDPGFGRKISVAKSGSKITTVWNPGMEACATIGDLPDDAYKTFVCIEAVNSFEDTIILNPGESHETSAIIGLVN
jgi:glucose-6-phosphate 1-epimerase